MSETTIARRYACALFELSQENVDLSDDMSALAVVAENDDAKAFMINTQVSAEDRADVLCRISETKEDSTKRLVTLLCQRNKASLLFRINEMFQQMVREAKATVMVDVTVATDLTDELKTQLQNVVSQGIGKKVELNVQADSSIVGGLILNIGDRQIDHSVRGRLDSLRRTLAA
ncbi:MAG: F0F1 ATP synthase subunit delta [Mariprofundaceae bacterium]|nr:F0F1 ATP synthase subunit delta [Mariprofundaceae bacterium]